MSGFSYGGIDPKDAATFALVDACDLVRGRKIEVQLLRTNQRKLVVMDGEYSRYDSDRILGELRRRAAARETVRVSAIRALMKSVLRNPNLREREETF